MGSTCSAAASPARTPEASASAVVAESSSPDVASRKVPLIEDKYFNLALEAAPCGMLMIDTGGIIRLVNHRAAIMFGYSREELLGQVMEMLLPVSMRGRHPCLRARFFRDPAVRTFAHAPILNGCRRDGSEFPVEMALNPVYDGDEVLALAAISDITAKIALERRFGLALDAAAAALLFVGHDITIENANAFAAKMFDYSKFDMRGMHLGTVLDLDAQGLEALITGAGNGAPAVELAAFRKDRSVLSVEVVVTRLDPETVIIAVTDCTERRAQEALRRERDAAALMALNSADLLATMSHEIRTPLTGLIGALELIGDTNAGTATLVPTERTDGCAFACGSPRAPDDGTLLGIARHCAVTLLGTINDILAYAKLESGVEKAATVLCDPRDIVRDVRGVLETQLTAMGIEWEESIDPGVPRLVLLDEAKFRRVLLNLASNAVKFTRKGSVSVSLSVRSCSSASTSSFTSPSTSIKINNNTGTITSAAPTAVSPPTALRDPPLPPPSTSPRAPIHLRTATGDAPGSPALLLTLTVADTGVGIPAAVLPKLFRPFVQGDRTTTREFGGTGLGLAICKRLVEAMGGDIAVESCVGVGSTFTVRVRAGIGVCERPPVAGEAAQSRELATLKSQPPPLPAGVKVLLADDDGIARRVVTALLNRLGCVVVPAANGREAVAAVSRDTTIQCMLLDCEMPVMDGFQATAELRRQSCTLPIAAMTANALVGDRERCLGCGMNDYISKPVTLDTLRHVLQRLIVPG